AGPACSITVPVRSLLVRLHFLGDQLDARLCDRVGISPDHRDVVALRLQDVVDQLTGSVVLSLRDASNGCTPLPELVPRTEHEFLMNPHVVLNRLEHIVGRSVELAHCAANDFTEAGEPLDGHRLQALPSHATATCGLIPGLLCSLPVHTVSLWISRLGASARPCWCG